MSRVRPGEVWLASFEPVVGHEQGGTRPAIVVGSPVHCAFPISMALVAPCTSVDRGFPHHVAIDWRVAGLDRPTWVRTEDVRAISERRLVGATPRGSVTPADLVEIKNMLRVMFDL